MHCSLDWFVCVNERKESNGIEEHNRIVEWMEKSNITHYNNNQTITLSANISWLMTTTKWINSRSRLLGNSESSFVKFLEKHKSSAWDSHTIQKRDAQSIFKHYNDDQKIMQKTNKPQITRSFLLTSCWSAKKTTCQNPAISTIHTRESSRKWWSVAVMTERRQNPMTDRTRKRKKFTRACML